jgi:uncharacterized membrane protein YphA (DoxX/SURF4 family)
MPLPKSLRPIDIQITTWMAKHAVTFARITLGIVFFWFGVLKFFPGLSPAEQLAGRTMERISFGVVSANISLPILATWECLIGIGLFTGVALRATLLLLFVQMMGTLLPLVLYPAETFVVFPVVPSLEGQYIIKNVVLISAAIVVGATVRGGRLVANPSKVKTAR